MMLKVSTFNLFGQSYTWYNEQKCLRLKLASVLIIIQVTPLLLDISPCFIVVGIKDNLSDRSTCIYDLRIAVHF